MCDPPIIYRSLPEYTPIFNNFMRPSQNLPLPPRIYPLFNNYMWPFQNLPLTPRIYPPFQQLYATLPESTSPSQNIPLFSTIICDHPRIYLSLPEYTPFSTTICDRPRIYPSLPESTPSPFSTTISDLPRIYSSLSEYTPILQLFATLPESTPLSRNIPPFFNNYNIMRPSQNLPLPPRIYPPFSTTIRLCDPLRICPSLPEYLSVMRESGRLSHNYMKCLEKRA